MPENNNKRKNISYSTRDDVNRIDNIWKRCLCSIPWFNILEKGEGKWIPRDPNPRLIVIDRLLAAMLTTNDNSCTLREFDSLMSLHVLINLILIASVMKLVKLVKKLDSAWEDNVKINHRKKINQGTFFSTSLASLVSFEIFQIRLYNPVYEDFVPILDF